MRTSGDGDDGAGLRRRGGQHARDGAGGGGHVLLLRKIVHALLCFLALSPSLWKGNGWAQKSRRNGRRERRSGGSFRRHGIVHQRRKTDGYAPARPPFPPSLFARHLPLFLLLLLNRASTALHAVAPLNRNEETSSSSAPVDQIDPSFSQATTRMSAPSW